MKRLHSLTLIPTFVLATTMAMPVSAQFAKPEDAIKYRKAAFSVLATHFGRVAAMANGKVPFDAKVAADNAEIVAMVSALPFTGFVPGSGIGKTDAHPKLWAEQEKFNASASKMQEEVRKLNTAAKSGNFDVIKVAVADVSKACKSCHDDYKRD